MDNVSMKEYFLLTRAEDVVMQRMLVNFTVHTPFPLPWTSQSHAGIHSSSLRVYFGGVGGLFCMQ